MHLYLGRHGDAAPGADDDARPLTELGKMEVQLIAKLMLSREAKVDRIFHSGKLRAQQTAEIFAEIVAPEAPIEPMPGICPNDPIQPIANEVLTWEENTFLVGHLPFMGLLASLLLKGDQSANAATFETGTVAFLERQDDLSWNMHWLLWPNTVEDL